MVRFRTFSIGEYLNFMQISQKIVEQINLFFILAILLILPKNFYCTEIWVLGQIPRKAKRFGKKLGKAIQKCCFLVKVQKTFGKCSKTFLNVLLCFFPNLFGEFAKNPRFPCDVIKRETFVNYFEIFRHYPLEILQLFFF